MPARQHTPMSGSPVLADLARGSAARSLDHDNGYDDAASPIRPVELKPKVAPRKVTASFTGPLRDSFFDLAQRYQSLRDAARTATRAKKKEAAPLMNTVIRERRLTDLPPPPDEDSVADRELPEEPTLVQPLALRALEPVPPASEKRPTTLRPPPPPDPLPRMLMPSTMPPPVAMPSSVPPPPGPPPSVWRPMLAAAALSATIGALVAGGFMALRGLTTPRPVATVASTDAPIVKSDAASAGPCPVGASTTAGSTATSGTSLSSTTLTSTSGTFTSSSGSSRGSSFSSSNGAAPLQVSIDNLPIEPRSSVLPANAFAHVAPVTISRSDKPTPAAAPAPAPVPVAQTVAAPKAVAVATPKQTASERAAERKRAKREAQATAAAARESQKASDDDDDDADKPAAALPPPPVPTKGPDRAAIAKAVARATGAATSCDSGPRQGRALITFAPSGNVQSVALVESFGDNAVNGCVLRALGRAHVAPFAGGPIEVRKGISW